MSQKKFYTVPFVWNRTLWVMTFVVFIAWIAYSAWNLWVIFTTDNDMGALVALLILNLTMLPLVIICEGLAPQRLEIGEKQLVILRRYKSVVIYADEVKSVEQLPKNALRGAIRTCGVGGFFGYFGSYYKSGIGVFKLYATSFDNLYLIRKWDGKSIVVSCSDPDKMNIFLNSVKH
jgi:hypothetical protein